MKKASEYSSQELAAMSWEELIAHVQLCKEEQFAQSTLTPPSESSAPPMQPETLRVIGGL